MSELSKAFDRFLNTKKVAVLWIESILANKSMKQPIGRNHCRRVTQDPVFGFISAKKSLLNLAQKDSVVQMSGNGHWESSKLGSGIL